MSSEANTAGSDLPPSARMDQLLNGYRVTQALYVAARLGIADLLRDGPKTAEELAVEAGANANALYRILRAPASLDVFAEVAERRFALTPVAELLRSDHPRSVRPLALFLGQDAYAVWADLLYSARTGAPAFDHRFGAPHFEYLAQHAEAAAVFNAAMSANVSRSVAATVSAYAFPATGVVVDVGGGHGAFIAAILRANPGLSGVLFDMPHVVEGAAPILEEAGAADRCARVGGDFFAPPLPAGDVYTLRQIIHDWDDERSVAILRNCARAMAADGRVLVIEAIIPPGNEPSRIKYLDLQMLVMNGGRQRTEAEYRQLYAAAGLQLTRVIPTSTDFSIIEGMRAE
jgi:O-methyltransferase/methyltransferase family protein